MTPPNPAGAPASMGREDVARWLVAFMYDSAPDVLLDDLARIPKALTRADAVIALVRAKVEQAVEMAFVLDQDGEPMHFGHEIVERVMGEPA